MDNKLLLFTLLLGLVIGGFSVHAFYDYNNRIIQGRNIEQVDSLTVVANNAITSRSNILDSLNTVSEALATVIANKDEQIASYARINATLRAERDSVVNLPTPIHTLIDTVSGGFKDTTITRSQTWSDSLFETTATLEIKNDNYSLHSGFRQLRPVDIQLVTTITVDNNGVNSYVRSEDFREINVEAFTELKPKRRKPWGWIVAGVLATIQILKEI